MIVLATAWNPTPKLTSIIAGMAADADSIDDLDVIRSGGMKWNAVRFPNSTFSVPSRGQSHSAGAQNLQCQSAGLRLDP